MKRLLARLTRNPWWPLVGRRVLFRFDGKPQIVGTVVDIHGGVITLDQAMRLDNMGRPDPVNSASVRVSSFAYAQVLDKGTE